MEWSERAAVSSDEFEGVTANLEHVVHKCEQRPERHHWSEHCQIAELHEHLQVVRVGVLVLRDGRIQSQSKYCSSLQSR